ncbi:MAG: pyridoxal phosphate-dependent aminotransferase [Faecalibacterium sp.]
MQAFVHGGDWAGYRAEHGRDALDFSANVSPLGLPPAVAEAITQALPGAARYPDPFCRELCTAIGKAERISPAHVLCGSGAADLIYRLVWAQKPCRALVTAPAFAEYEAALDTVNCRTEHWLLSAENHFDLTEAFCDALSPGMELVFLCQPNNPTGRLTESMLLRRILDRCAALGIRLAVDECFLDFLPDRSRHTLVPLVEEYPNLILFKAFTKLYAMAGVRLGYALCADDTLLEQMRKAGPPWAVSSLAQAAGLAALRETAYADAVRALVQQQRPRLQRELEALGLHVVPGCANYLLFRGPTGLCEALAARGIVLRSCGNYHGLGPEWYRTAVRTEAENNTLLYALKEVLA